MISSDSSDSESNISSDSEIERLAVKAYQCVKTKFQKQKCINNRPEADVRPLTAHRKKIYETFIYDSESEEEKQLENNCKNEEVDAVYKESEQMFFLDKNPATRTVDIFTPTEPCAAETDIADRTTDLQETDKAKNKSGNENGNTVIVTDLSNLHSNEDGQEIQSHEAGKKKHSKTKSADRSRELASGLKTGMNSKDIYVNVNPYKNPHAQRKVVSDTKPKDLEVMKKCVITDDFEKQDSINPIESLMQQKKQRKLEREKTKGDKWFNMAAPEITDERKHDLTVLQMRKVLDPKRFYKSSDTKAPPKYFQFGRVVESAADFYNSRVPKKQRKSTMVEELLADAEFRQFNKRKYEEIQDLKRQGKGPYQRMKRLRKKKKQK